MWTFYVSAGGKEDKQMQECGIFSILGCMKAAFFWQKRKKFADTAEGMDKKNFWDYDRMANINGWEISMGGWQFVYQRQEFLSFLFSPLRRAGDSEHHRAERESGG